LIGETLSHYRITAALGAGGMGEVYRATDTTLGRDVAIKVLPPEVAQDPERLARFEREARLLASLNHPNIAAIYGLEEADGQPFLALELVEGEDLKERLAKGPIPVDEALEIAEQIAEALEEAHNKGIVHRDLKPANVKLTPDGKVKVLDFGLAKAWAGDTPEGSSPSGVLSQSPTLAHTGTVAGVILGTAAYMSPEQARGKPVDKRADIWSFGVLTWEILTGQSLFAGGTVTDVIAAVVKEEPDLDALPKTTPAAVRRLLSRCLRKDPRTRLPDIGAARLELQDVRAGTAVEVAPPSGEVEEVRRTERRSRARERWAWAAAFLLAAGVASLFAYQRLTETPEPRPPAHFTLDTPKDLAFSGFDPVAVSPDGRHVAFVGTSPGRNPQLWMRSLDSLEARPLPGTEGAGSPFWSADGTEIAFTAGRELRKLTLAGGTVQRLCALPDPTFVGGTWSADGLPDARHILFAISSTKEANAGLFVTSLESRGERRRIRPEFARFRYAPPGALLFVRDGNLLAQRFDARKLATAGEPVPMASGVAGFSFVPDWGWFSASATGRLAWLSGQTSDTQLEWVDRQGRRLAALGEHGRYGQIAISPDDKRVVAEIAGADGGYDLWVIDVARGVPSRLTTDPANDRDPVWSPDSQQIIYSSDASGDQNLLRKGLEGSEPPAPLPGGIGQTPGDRDIAKAWLPEGNTLLYPDHRRQADSLEGPAGRKRAARDARERLLYRPAPRLSRRPLARVHLAGIRALRGLRRAVRPARGESACLHGRRWAAPVARRREGALLPVAQRGADGRQRPAGSEERRRRVAHHARPREGPAGRRGGPGLQRLLGQLGRPALPGEAARRRRRDAAHPRPPRLAVATRVTKARKSAFDAPRERRYPQHPQRRSGSRTRSS
jgi:hypothetical protein